MKDYESYTAKELIEAYRSIDKEKYPDKTKLIEEQIYIKCDLDRKIELNSPELQNLYDSIILEKEVETFKEPYNLKTGALINRLSWLILFITIIPFLFFQENIRIKYLPYLLFGMSFYFLAQALQSIFTREIFFKWYIIEKEYPKLFRNTQSFYFLFCCILFLFAIGFIISS